MASNMKHHSLSATGCLAFYMAVFCVFSLYWGIYSRTRRTIRKRRR